MRFISLFLIIFISNFVFGGDELLADYFCNADKQKYAKCSHDTVGVGNYTYKETKEFVKPAADHTCIYKTNNQVNMCTQGSPCIKLNCYGSNCGISSFPPPINW